MAESILAELAGGGTPTAPTCLWLTCAEAAQRLGVSPGYVRRLARQREIAAEQTGSGQWLFRWAEVWRVAIHRREQQVKSRPAQLRAQRLRMVHAAWLPRQISLVPLLFGKPARPRLVRGGERGVPDAEPKRARSPENVRVSEKENSVNRKARAS